MQAIASHSCRHTKSTVQECDAKGDATKYKSRYNKSNSNHLVHWQEQWHVLQKPAKNFFSSLLSHNLFLS
jgi:hypothetical protein